MVRVLIALAALVAAAAAFEVAIVEGDNQMIVSHSRMLIPVRYTVQSDDGRSAYDLEIMCNMQVDLTACPTCTIVEQDAVAAGESHAYVYIDVGAATASAPPGTSGTFTVGLAGTGNTDTECTGTQPYPAEAKTPAAVTVSFTVSNECPSAGYYTTNGGAVISADGQCEPCPAGSAAASQETDACPSCPAGTYASGLGNTECAKCPRGISTAAGSTECTACPPGKEADDAKTKCVEMPSNAVSPGVIASLSVVGVFVVVVGILVAVKKPWIKDDAAQAV